MRIVDRVAYINHDIDDAVRAGVLGEDDLPRDEIALLGADRLGAHRRARPRPRRDSAAAGDIVQSDEVGAAMLALRAFMFERVYLGPHGRARAPARARRRSRRSSTHSSTIRTVCRGRRAAADRVVDYLAGMTDRFALTYAARRGSA